MMTSLIIIHVFLYYTLILMYNEFTCGENIKIQITLFRKKYISVGLIVVRSFSQ